MKNYTPRRAGKQWRKDAPDYILDCFDDQGAGERYTVLFTGKLLITDGTFAGTFIQGGSECPARPAIRRESVCGLS